MWLQSGVQLLWELPLDSIEELLLDDELLLEEVVPLEDEVLSEDELPLEIESEALSSSNNRAVD